MKQPHHPGGCHATSINSNWYKHDKTSYEGSKIDAIISQFGLQQLIKEPIHILKDSSPCIDLLFTSQPNLVMESGVHSSLHQNCHHQIIYAKINFKVFYPPPYEREIWHYQRADVDQIQQAIEQFSWEKSFRNLNINEMVSLFNKTIKNILSTYFQIIFLLKESHVITKTHLGLIKTLSS